MDILGISAKRARNVWFRAMLNEYETYKDALVKASTVTLEEEPEEEAMDPSNPSYWEQYKVD